MNPVDNFWKNILNIVFPQHCFICSKPSSWFICDDCLEQLKIYNGKRCRICSKPIISSEHKLICPLCMSNRQSFLKGFSLFNYNNETVKRLIELLKFYDRPQIIDILFMYRDTIKNLEVIQQCDAIIPIPMHRTDIIERGYNQSVIIAKKIAGIVNIPIIYDSLIKIKQTKKQVGLNYNERIRNLSKAFHINKRPKVKKVLLVDDVFTTGSTINECAKLLKGLSVESNFFTLATTPFGIFS